MKILKNKFVITIILGFLIGYIWASYVLFLMNGFLQFDEKGNIIGGTTIFSALNPFYPMSPAFYFFMYANR